MTLPLPDQPRRLVYLGTPALAVPTLDALVDAGYEVPLVVTGPDARRSRRGDPEPSPVKVAAFAHGLAVTHELSDIADVTAEMAVVVAYGRIIPTSLLDVLPMVNLHFSLLPRWRGAAPVERALLAGDERTGVCLMDVVEALDEGDVFARAEIPIGPDATLESLRAELVHLGTDLLLDGLRDGFGLPTPQIGAAVYAHKITNDDRRIDPDADAETFRRVVAVGGAWTTFRGRRFKVGKIAVVSDPHLRGEPGELIPPADGRGPCVVLGSGGVELVDVQPEGKPSMDAAAWARGARLEASDRLGT